MTEESLVETLGSSFLFRSIDILLARKSIQTISLLAKQTPPFMRKSNTYLGGI